ncbi:TonB family protein [Bacteroidota bacterium]
MESILNYMIEAGVCLSLFYLTYRLLLHRDTFFSINRYFLIITLFAALLIPVVSFTSNANEGVMYYGTIQTIIVTADNIENTVKTSLNSWEIAAIIYLTGVAIFFIKFIVQMIQLMMLIKKNGIKKINGYKIVFTDGKFAPFSFFNIIFLNESFMYNSETEQILAHEKVHIDKKHTYDIVLMELITIVQWFNPFIWFYRRSLRDVHEYQADEGVINRGYDKIDYQQLILKQISAAELFQPANNFNYSTIKRRIVMITKSRTKKIAIAKLLLVIPISLLMILAFSSSRDEDLFVWDKEGEQSEIKPDSFPQFPGGWDNVYFYIDDNLKIPKEFLKRGIPAKVAVRFEIMKDGSIENVRIGQHKEMGKKWTKGNIGNSCDDVVIKLIENMLKWKPAYYKCEPVNYTQSLVLLLGNKAMKSKWKDFYDDEGDWLSMKHPPNSHSNADQLFQFMEEKKKMLKYIQENLKYPEEARKNSIEGTVHITFRVDKDGNVSGVKVQQSIGYGCDDEAVRVLVSMPKVFTGNGSDDKFVEMTIPIKFRLADKSQESNKAIAKVKYEPDHLMELDKMPKLDMNKFRENFTYPEEARKKGIQGVVYIKALVGKDGNVTKTKVDASDNEIFNESAIKSIEATHFEPGIKDNKPVDVWVTIPVTFRLK